MEDELINKSIADWQTVAQGGSIDTFKDDLKALRQRDEAAGGHSKWIDDISKVDGQLKNRGQLPNLLVLGAYNNEVVVEDPTRKQYGVLRSAHGLLREEDLVSAPPIFQKTTGDEKLEVKQESTPPLYSDPSNPLKNINPDKVIQGLEIGDCRFAAKLTSLAKEDPEAITKMIADNKDGTYTVTFPGDKDHPITVSAPNTWEQETFTYHESGTWYGVIEKAYRQRLNEPMGVLTDTPEQRELSSVEGLLTNKKSALLYQYDKSLSCNASSLENDERDIKEHPGQHMPLCPESTAQISISSWASLYPGRNIPISSQEDLHNRLSEVMSNHMLMSTAANLPTDQGVAAFPTVRDKTGNDVLILPLHAYTVTNYDPNTRTVTIRNPWAGNPSSVEPLNIVGDGYIDLPLAQFEKYFTESMVEETDLSKLE